MDLEHVRETYSRAIGMPSSLVYATEAVNLLPDLLEEIDHLKTRAEEAEAEVERLKKNLEWGLEIINRGLEIMTDEQLSEWEGVRAWAELGTE